MIKTFLFDLGNVLVNFSHERMFRQIGQLCGRSAAETKSLLLEGDLFLDFECGRLTEEEFADRLGRRVGTRLDPEELYRAGSDIFEANAKMPPILAGLRDEGYRLVLLSNTCISHFRFVKEHFDVLEYFAEFVLSYEVGSIKPADEMFLAALEKIHCEPSECFYTDDIAENIAAGLRHGLQAEPFTSAAQLLERIRELGVDPDSTL